MSTALNIAVVGAGMGGLTAATLLARQGHAVTLFDQFAAPRPVGSGLVVQPVGQQVLSSLGALDAALAQGNKVWRMQGHEAENGRQILDAHYGTPGGQSFGLAIHRAALFDALFGVLPSQVNVVTNARVVAARQGRLTFQSGPETGAFDLIVDGSGATSQLSPMRARVLPYGAIWGWVDWPANAGLDAGMLHQMYRRADRMMGIMPMGLVPGETGQKAAVFWSLPKDGHEAWRQKGIAAWHKEIAALWPAGAAIFAQIRDPDQMTMARYSHGMLRKPNGDGIAYIGDAAHRASPQLGQGANMALLDAHALAAALQQARGNIGLALGYYAAARRWYVRVYQAMSWAFTPQYQSDSRILPWLRDHVLSPLTFLPPLQYMLTRVVRGDLLPVSGSLPPPRDALPVSGDA